MGYVGKGGYLKKIWVLSGKEMRGMDIELVTNKSSLPSVWVPVVVIVKWVYPVIFGHSEAGHG